MVSMSTNPQEHTAVTLCVRVSLVAQLVKNPLVMQEILLRFLRQEDSLEKG